jgi:beta-alanine degradation protein BauB
MMTGTEHARSDEAAAAARARWPLDVQRDFEKNQFSGVVGTTLVSETDRVRVWYVRIPVGQRSPFHRHVLDYFFTVLSDGHQRVYYDDGRTIENEQCAGDTMHFNFRPGQYFVHCVENIGTTELTYTTVEFLDGANPPLPVPDTVRRIATPRP